MKKYQQFVLFWLADTLLIYLSNQLLPDRFALGNNIFTPVQAAIFSGFVLSFSLWYFPKFLEDVEIKLKGTMQMMVAYLAANFLVLWVIARFAFMTGFGVFSFVWVLLLAVVADITQYYIWQYSSKKNR